MNVEQFFKEYSWEALESECKFTGDITAKDTMSPPAIEQNIESLHIYRDDKYKICVKAEGSIPEYSFEQDKLPEVPVGTLLPGGVIECDAMHEGIITVKECFRRNHTIDYKLSDRPEVAFHALYQSYEVNWNRRMLLPESETDTLIEWYLNGPDSTVLFCDASKTIDKVSRNVKRNGVKIASQGHTTESYSADCLYIKYLDTGVLLRKIPSEYKPEWNHKVALEYRTAYGRIPEAEERKKVAELLGFLMGRHLILVGDTAYQGAVILESNMYDPCADVASECSGNTLEIIPVHYYHNERNNFREFAQTLLPAYLELRDTYGLDLVLGRYWLSNTMPIGVNMPIIAGAMESIQKVWFKGQKSKTKAVYMDKDAYEEAISEFVEQLEAKLGGCENKDKLLRKILNCYQMGANEKYYTFLDELGLEYGDAEKECIKARNCFTHGDNNDNYEEVIKHTKTMSLLLARSILKLLGYSGMYIDTSVLGYPRKHIDEKIG
ncbi:MAG: hypothetical protein J6K15_00420 [Lachnospiraceae bacterium]|nr:hypothetical protein [Lachnospiraceae bacterium]